MLVIEYLQSGLYNVDTISAVVDRYVTEAAAIETRERARLFAEHAIWDYRRPEQELVAEGRQLVNSAASLDPYTVTSMHELLADIPGGTDVGDEIVAKWIEAFNERKVEGLD